LKSLVKVPSDFRHFIIEVFIVNVVKLLPLFLRSTARVPEVSVPLVAVQVPVLVSYCVLEGQLKHAVAPSSEYFPPVHGAHVVDPVAEEKNIRGHFV
jgi:hypothetical protein